MLSSVPTQLLRTPEAADRLGIDRSTLTRWVARGWIKPAFTVPGYRGIFLFDPEQLDLIREHAMDPRRLEDKQAS